MMSFNLRLVIALLFISVVVMLRVLGIGDYLNFDWFNLHRDELLAWVSTHYTLAVLGFMALYAAAVIVCLPIVGILTVVGGLLFGTVPAAIYVNIGATIGAIVLFLLVRYVIGSWLQERFKNRLVPVNRALEGNGTGYLLAIHLVVVIPFSVATILLGLTKISLWTFTWTTSLGIIPGSLVYAFAGQQLTHISSLRGILSPGVVAAFVLLGLMAVLPTLYQQFKRRMS